MAKINKVRERVERFALLNDGGGGGDFSVDFFHEFFDHAEGDASGNDIVNDGDFFIFEKESVWTINDEGLDVFGKEGEGFHNNG